MQGIMQISRLGGVKSVVSGVGYIEVSVLCNWEPADLVELE